MNAQTTISNLINGNITDAKHSAKRHSHAKLVAAGNEALGLYLEQARASADFLKGLIDWETYCQRTAPKQARTP